MVPAERNAAMGFQIADQACVLESGRVSPRGETALREMGVVKRLYLNV